MKERSFVIISGYSGSGKSTALNTLEDLGYYTVDNLPAELLPSFVHLVETGHSGIERAAMVLDIRGGESVGQYPDVIRSLINKGYRITVIFLEASVDVLQKRFSETRRVHPLDPKMPLVEALEMEKDLLQPLLQESDMILDTTDHGPHDLRRVIRDRFTEKGTQGNMLLSFMSFGFKYGLPKEADLIFDVRFLPNPYFDDELRALDGRDEAVSKYVENSENAGNFFERLFSFIEYLLPRYSEEGRGYLTVAIGCTGGQHRSVAIVEKLSKSFTGSTFVNIRVRHRELGED